jgi:hypothetical protein
MDKPLPQTLKLSVEEYMETLGLPEYAATPEDKKNIDTLYKQEMGKYQSGLNGTTAEDLYNVISKPKHYMLFEEEGIEVRDVIAKLVTKFDAQGYPDSPLFISDYVQLLQYIMRFMDKNGVEDLKKARWYLDKMIESY